MLLGANDTIFRQNALSLASLSGTGNLSIIGGVLSIAQASSTGSLTMNGGTFAGAGTLTTATLAFTSGTLGQYNNGGTTVNVGGTTTFDGTSTQQVFYGTTLNLNGGATWTTGVNGGNAINIYSGGQGTSSVNLKAGQTFADQGMQAAGQTRYLGNYSDGVFNNAGTYVRSGLGTTIVSAAFNNTGALQVNSGTFDFGGTQGVHTNSGSIAIASGATLEANGTFTSTTGSITNGGTLLVDGGTTTLQAGSSYTGSGAINVTGGLFDSQITGTIAPTSLTLTGGTTRFAGTANSGTLSISNATLSGAGTVNAGTLNFTSGTIGEYNHGGLVVNVSGSTTIDGTSSQQLYYGTTLNLNGGATWTASPNSGNAFNIYSGGQGTTAVNLKAGQTFADQGMQAAGQYRYLGNYGDGVFNNAGTYVRNGAGTTLVNAAFNNTGAVQVNSGEFSVSGTGGSSSGTWAIAAPGTLTFANGRNTLTAGSISNAGVFNISGGALLVTGTVGVTGANGLNFTGGNQGGNGTFTLNALNWSSGTFGDYGVTGGTTTVNGPTTIDGTTSQQITYGHTLNLNGTTNWTASNQGYLQVYNSGVPTSTLNVGAGATFNDQGNLAANQVRYFGLNTDGAININGTYNRNGLGTTQVNAASFTNSGTVNVNGGALSLQSTAGSSGGTFNVASGATLDFTSGTFTLTGGTINNAGTAGLSGGSLNVTAAASVTGAGGFAITGGQLYGGGQLNLSALTFTGGTIGANQRTAPTVTVSGPATISGGQQNISYGATLALNGATTWQQSNQGLLAISSSGQGATTLAIGSTGTFADQGNLLAGQTRYLGYYSDGIVANAGTYLRTGDGTTQVNAQFNNAGSGVVTVNGGRLQLANGGTSTGTFNTGTNGTLEFSGGTYTLAGGTISSAGTAILTGGAVNVSQTTSVTGTGGFSVSGGQLYGAGALNASAFTFTGGTIGASSLAAPTVNVSGPAIIGGNGQQNISYGGVLNLNGATTWQQSTQGLLAISDGGQGAATLAIGATGTFTDQGNLLANQFRYLGYYSDGHVANAGNYLRTGDGTTQVNASFTNASTGTVTVDGGRLQFANGGTSSGAFTTGANGTIEFGGGTYVLAGGSISGTGTTVLTGGNLNVTQTATVTGTGGFTVAGGQLYGSGAVNASAFTFAGGTLGASGQTAPTVNVSGSAIIAGNGQQNIFYGGTLNLNGTTTWQQSTQGLLAISDSGQGSSTLAIGAGGTFNDQGNLQANQTRYLGYYGDGHVTNAGTYTRSGDGTTQVTATFANTGTVNVASGSMQFTNSVGGSGTLQTSGTGVLDIASARGASVSTGALALGSSTANNLVLGNTNVLVAGDYSNAAFGTGNAFNKIANVSGTGLINAVNATQAITGSTVTNGTTANATLTINNVRVGATTYNYQVADTGTTTALRGAIQTAGNGAAITDARLSGAGVTAGNYGPVAAGSNSGNLGVTFTAMTAGALAPLTGTNAVHIANNFANVAEQNLDIVIGAGAAAYNTAIGNATPPSIAFGNVRVNGSLSRALTVSNTQVTGAYSEDLNAAFGPSTGAAVGSGSINQLVAGSSNASAMIASLASGTAGAKTGTVTLDYATSGTVNGVSNGLGVLGVGSQTITLTGGVYNAAVGSTTPTPVIIANQRIGGTATQTLTVANTAAAGSFSEALNASFGVNTGTAINNGGNVSDIAAGSSNASALSVGVNTNLAGAKTGSVTIAYQTDGTGGNGHSGLAAASAGSQTINVSGGVYQMAQASVPTTVNLGNVHAGGTASQALTIGNTNVAPTGYQEGLDVAVGTVGSGATASGGISNLAAGGTSSAVSVGLSTITAGVNARSVALNLATNGTGTSGLATQSLGTATVAINATGYNLAAGAATPTPVAIANQRVGGTNSQALTVQNTAASGSYTEGLNASFASNGGSAINNGGSIALLTGQSSNASALSVGVNTANSGAKTGTVTLNYVSDGSGTSGLGQTAAGSQTINVTGNVYALANGSAGTVTPVAARVGDTVASKTIAITNVSPDVYTEALKVTLGATSTGFTASGSINALAAQGTSNAIAVKLDTTTAGTFTGTQALNYISTGVGTTGAADLAVGTGSVALSGRVYTPAVSQLNTGSVAFGIVHVRDTVTAQGVSVTNAAATTALNDVLVGAAIGASGPFTASGTLGSGLAAQQTSTTGLNVGLNTATAGIYSGSAAFSAASHDSDLSDAALSNLAVSLTGTVNNYAADAFSFGGGSGTLSQSGSTYILDYGTIQQNSGTLTTSLLAGNSATGPADLLDGSFQFLDAADFGESGFGAFGNLVAGMYDAPLGFSFSSMTLGAFSDTIVLHGLGHNASGYSAAIGDIQLIVRGVVAPAGTVSVPEPDSLLLLGLGIPLLLLRKGRKRHNAALH